MRLILPLIFLLVSTPFFAQTDSTAMEYIYLERYRPGDESAVQPWERDFMRNRVLIRVNLFHPANAPIHQIVPPVPFDALCPGLPGLILSAMFHHQMPALHPADPSKELSYLGILDNLIEWQGLTLPDQEEIPGSSLGLEWMLPAIDLIVDKRIDQTSGRRVYRIRFIRMIWHHPNLALGPRAMALVPYDRVRPYLQRFTCDPGPDSPANLTVADFLEKGYVVGTALRLPADPVLALPSQQRREAPEPRIDWER